MQAFNLIWIQPTQISSSEAEGGEIITESFVQGGEDKNSFYVRQLNTKTNNAVAMVLARGSEVYVAMLHGLHELFPNFSKGQAEKLLPNKSAVKKITPEVIRGIANRVAVDSGFKGVGQCRCLPLHEWNQVMLSASQ